MGVHHPFRNSYMWLVKHLPFFWVVRSPYFKFGTLICLGYAFFIGIASIRIYEYLFNKRNKVFKIFGQAVILIVICSNLIYAFPVTTGKMYVSQEERTLLPPFRVKKIPCYVFETAEYLNSKAGFFRIFFLPVYEPQLYRWGFCGAMPVLSHFASFPALFRYNVQYILTGQVSPNMAEGMVDCIKKALYSRKTIYMSRLFRLLNVRYIVQENDIRYDFFGGRDSPLFIKDRLKNQVGIHYCKSFGEWDVYNTEEILPHIYAVEKATLINGDIESFIPLTNTGILDKPCLIINNAQNSKIVEKCFNHDKFKEVVYYKPDKQTNIFTESNLKGDTIFYFSTFEMHGVPYKGKDVVSNDVQIKESKGFHEMSLWNDGWYLLMV